MANVSSIKLPNNTTYNIVDKTSGYTKNTGTVTSVAVSAGTGISVSGSPITSNGTITISNSGVTGVKGNAESSYRTGQVNLTAANVGAVAKSGDTMTGKLTLKADQYTDAYNSGALDLKNSNIDGVNSIYTADSSENAQEGIHFYRDSTHVDSIYARNGILYFTPNRQLGTNGIPQEVYSIPQFQRGTTDISIRPLISRARANRLAFLPSNQVIIEKTIDGGATWTDAGYTDTQKIGLFATSGSIVIPLLNNAKSELCGLRVTITGMKYDVPSGTSETDKYSYWNSEHILSQERYFNVREWWFWLSSNNDTIQCEIQAATGANSTTWKNIFNTEFHMTGWSGSDWIRAGSGATFGGGTTQTDNYWNWRLIFWSRKADNKDTFQSATAQSINIIQCYGDSVWGTPNSLMSNDHLYSYDNSQNATFPAKVTASGGFNGNLTGNVTGNVSGSAGSVAWSGVSSKPTTLSGYGITDAKIASGTITLGSNTITPLTSSSTLSAAKLSGAIPSAVTATTQASTDNSTKIATTAYVTTAIANLPEPMVFKGSVGTGGTVTSLPTAAAANEGWTYKVITALSSPSAKVGDTVISNGSSWVVIPSGDEPSGTVTSITLKAGSGISLDTDDTAITTTGIRTISHADTSSQVSSSNSGRTYIQSITLDTYGHVTGISTATESVTNTDTKLQVAAVTSGTQYYPIVGTGTSAATRQYDTTGFKYKGTNGTTSAVGSAILELGNSTASGTANNKQAQLIMYGSNAKKATITLAAPSADIALALPTSGGTLALTSQIPTYSIMSASELSTGTATTARTMSAANTKAGLLDLFYPVGSYYETSDANFDPNTKWGGTWVLEAEGKVHIGAGTNYAVGATGGEATHTLTVDEIPSHTHSLPHVMGYVNSAAGGNGTYGAVNTWTNVGNTGGGKAHNNMPPYIVVNRWHRTA